MIGDITVLIAFIIFLAISGYAITYVVGVGLLFGIILLINFIDDVITTVKRSIWCR